jgi:hypothetical protein
MCDPHGTTPASILSVFSPDGIKKDTGNVGVRAGEIANGHTHLAPDSAALIPAFGKVADLAFAERVTKAGDDDAGCAIILIVEPDS